MGVKIENRGVSAPFNTPQSEASLSESAGLLEWHLLSEQSEREGEAPTALPLEGATQAPIIETQLVIEGLKVMVDPAFAREKRRKETLARLENALTTVDQQRQSVPFEGPQWTELWNKGNVYAAAKDYVKNDRTLKGLQGARDDALLLILIHEESLSPTSPAMDFIKAAMAAALELSRAGQKKEAIRALQIVTQSLSTAGLPKNKEMCSEPLAVHDEAANLLTRLEKELEREEGVHSIEEFVGGILGQLLNPETWMMGLAGKGAGAIGRGIIGRFGIKGVKGIKAIAAATAAEGAFFHAFNNIGASFIDGSKKLDWSAGGFLHSIAMMSWLRVVGGGYGKGAKAVEPLLKQYTPQLGKWIFQAGSWSAEALGFASFDSGAEAVHQWKSGEEGHVPSLPEILKRVVQSTQMVLAFKAMHAAEQKSGLARTEKILRRAHEEVAGLGANVEELADLLAREETKTNPRLTRLETAIRAKMLVLYKARRAHFDAMEAELRYLYGLGKISSEEFVARRSYLNELRDLDAKAKTTLLESFEKTFQELEEVVGVVSSGLRADTSPEHRVGMHNRYGEILGADGAQKLSAELQIKNVEIRKADTRPDIFQTDDPNRSIVELASNGLDAGSKNIHITLKDGFYQITDCGTGMDEAVLVERLLIPKLSGKPDSSKQIGRFGIGFYTVLRHLKNNGESVVVETKTAGGKAWRLTYILKDGRILFHSEEAKLAGDDPIREHGTRITVNSAEIRESGLRAEASKYLRLVNKGKRIFINNEVISGFDYPPLEHLNRAEDYARLYQNESGGQRVTVKMGEIIVESFENQGDVLKGELVIELPHAARLSITRDSVAVDKPLYDYLVSLAGRAENLETLNTLAGLYTAFDKRHEFEPLLNALKKHAGEIAEAKLAGKRIYPDEAGLRERLASSENIVFVHPALYDISWLSRLETPKEFMSGEAVSAGGWRRPLRLVLSPDLNETLHYDPELGILYFNEALYKSRPEFVLSALFMVPGMEFRVSWSAKALEAGAKILSPAKPPEKAPDEKIKIGEAKEIKPRNASSGPKTRPITDADVEGILDFLEKNGLTLEDFTIRIPQQYSFLKFLEETRLVMVEGTDGGRNLFDFEKGKLVFEKDWHKEPQYNYPSFRKDRGWIIVRNNGLSFFYKEDGTPVVSGNLAGVVAEDGEVILPDSKMDYLTDAKLVRMDGSIVLEGISLCVNASTGPLFFVRDKGGRFALCRADGKIIARDLALDPHMVDTPKYGEKIWFIFEGKTEGGDSRITKVISEEGVVVAEADNVTMTDIGGKAWFYLQNGEKHTLTNADKTFTLEGNVWQIVINNEGNRAWIYFFEEGHKKKVYAEDGRLVLEGVHAGARYDGKAMWFGFVKDGRWHIWSEEKGMKLEFPYYGDPENGFSFFNIADTKGTIWVLISGRETILYKNGQPYMTKTKNRTPEIRNFGPNKYPLVRDYKPERKVTIYDGEREIQASDFIPLSAGGQDFIHSEEKLYDADLNPLLTANNVSFDSSQWKIFRYKTGRENLVSRRAPVFLNMCGTHEYAFEIGTDRLLEGRTIVPQSAITEFSADERAGRRLAHATNLRLSAENLVYPIRHASDSVWKEFTTNPEKQELLALLQSSDALAYAEAHLHDQAGRLRQALRVLDAVSIPVSVPETLVVERMDSLMRSGMNMERLTRDLKTGKESEDVVVVRQYLRSKDAVRLGHSMVSTPSALPVSLADAITHLRLYGRRSGIEAAAKARRYNSEEDQRQMEHAIHHLHATHPYIFVRELLQNALDVQRMPRRIATEADRKIEMDTFMEGPEFVLRVRDHGGMTEEEFVKLLLPGESSKGGQGDRGRFGIGFFSAMAGAKWVRVKTALKGSSEIITAEFECVRTASGALSDIRLRMEKIPNKEGFYGTVVETARASDNPILEAAHIKTRLEDMGQYVSRKEAEVFSDGKPLNDGRNGALVEHHSEAIGDVALYDGLANRILLGGLPLSDLPESLWTGLPEGIRDYYRRKGFYIDLDHTRLKPTPTRDRLENHAEVMAELGKILPGLLIHGFLKRVASARHAEELHELPRVYFVDSYRLASQTVVGRKNLENAEKINAGRIAEVDPSPYADGEKGRRNLLMLLTLIEFISVEGFKKPLSLRDIHQIYTRAAAGEESARSALEKIREADLPPGIHEKLAYATRAANTQKSTMARILEETEKRDADGKPLIEPERTYPLAEVKDAGHRAYLAFLQKVAQSIWSRAGGKAVHVGIHTFEKQAHAFALHYTEGPDYHLYRTYGSHLDADAVEFHAILAGPDRDAAFSRFQNFLTRTYEVVTHEINHVVNEHPDDPTHDAKFYRDQMGLILKPEFPKDQARRWFEEMRSNH